MVRLNIYHTRLTYIVVYLVGVWHGVGRLCFSYRIYGIRSLGPNDARQSSPIYQLFYHKWWFDELYRAIFILPVMKISGWVAACDKNGIDWLADNLARAMNVCAKIDNWIDRIFIDKVIDLLAGGTYAVGISLKKDTDWKCAAICDAPGSWVGGVVCRNEHISELFDFWMVRHSVPRQSLGTRFKNSMGTKWRSQAEPMNEKDPEP